ncbi:hypothetical protein BD414DRAFT_427588 [Trametes punicea]|nr:hypothetical protein BD414DRAFT_427588 [Trametes punicea]
MWAGDDWTYDYPDPRPRLGEPAVWAGLPEAVPPGIPNLTVYKPPTPPAAGATSAPLVAGAGNSQPSASNAGPSSLGGQPSVSDGQQPALNGQVAADLPEVTIPGEPYVTRSMRMPVDTAAPAISGRSPHRWRPGPAHKPGYVLAYVPQHGPCWIHESKAAKLPVRAWGTESRYAYVIAKEPSQIDEEWRQTHDGASPGPNPLQLSGVPEDVVAGPSRTIIRQEDEDDNGAHATARENSTLFTNLPETATRPAIGISIGSMAEPSDSSRAGPSGVRSPVGRNSSDVLTTQPEPGRSTTARPAVRGQVPNETLPAPSPASSWGPSNFQPSRRSSLSLQLNNFPPPSNVPQPTGSMEQLGLTNFGDAPLTLDIVIRTEPSSDRQVSELGLSSGAEGSSRQVVTGLQDLEDINRSLMQVTESSSQRDARNARSSTSSRHSRHSSLSSHESGAIIGPRTGLALYGSRSATRNSGSHPSTDPSSANLCALAQAGSPSRTSARSHAESTRSRKSSASSTGLQRSVSERPPRTSALASTSFPEPLALRQSSWTAEPADTHPYAPGGPNTASRPQASQESIPRSLDAIDGFGGTSGSLMLSFEAPSTSAAVDRNGEAATGIHAPRPVSSRHSSLFRVTWNASQ